MEDVTQRRCANTDAGTLSFVLVYNLGKTRWKMEQKNTSVTHLSCSHMKNMTLFIILFLILYQKILLTAYSLKYLKNGVSNPGEILKLLCSNTVGIGKAGT